MKRKIDGFFSSLKKITSTYAKGHSAVSSFWTHFPALHLSLFFLSGIGIHFSLGVLFFSLPFIPKKMILRSGGILLLGFLYSSYLHPSLPSKEGIQGEALIHIERVKKSASPFKTSLVYEMMVTRFSSNGGTLRQIPCLFYPRGKQKRPPADQDYLIRNATLIETAPHRYLLKGGNTEQWIPLKNYFSFAKWRYEMKEKIRKKLKRLFPSKPVYSLIAALTTGDLENRFLAFQFNRVGLQHLLVISGFHFAMLSLFLLALLGKLLPHRLASFALVFFLGIYFFYLGSAPSISRAWIAVFLFLIARLFSYRFSPLNALGIALFFALLKSPLLLFHIGFQLSFTATLGILLFYHPFEKGVSRLLPKRSFEESIALLPLDRIGYFLGSYLRKMLSLSGSVTLLTLPLLFFHFQKFPLSGLVYNLFFPFLFVLLMVMILGNLIFPFLFKITSSYATFLLNLITYAPSRLIFYVHVPPFPFLILLFLLASLLFFGVMIERSSSSIFLSQPNKNLSQ